MPSSLCLHEGDERAPSPGAHPLLGTLNRSLTQELHEMCDHREVPPPAHIVVAYTEQRHGVCNTSWTQIPEPSGTMHGHVAQLHGPSVAMSSGPGWPTVCAPRSVAAAGYHVNRALCGAHGATPAEPPLVLHKWCRSIPDSLRRRGRVTATRNLRVMVKKARFLTGC